MSRGERCATQKKRHATIIRGSTEPLIGRFFPHVIRCERKKLPFDDFHWIFCCAKRNEGKNRWSDSLNYEFYRVRMHRASWNRNLWSNYVELARRWAKRFIFCQVEGELLLKIRSVDRNGHDGANLKLDGNKQLVDCPVPSSRYSANITKSFKKKLRKCLLNQTNACLM